MILVYLVSRFYRYLFLICSFSLLLCFSFYFARIFIFFFLPFFPLSPCCFDKITILDVDIGIYSLSFILFFLLSFPFSPFLILRRYTFILWDYHSDVSCPFLSFLYLFLISSSFSLLLCFSFYFARIFIFFFLPFFPLSPCYFDKITILDVDVDIFTSFFTLLFFPFVFLISFFSFSFASDLYLFLFTISIQRVISIKSRH